MSCWAVDVEMWADRIEAGEDPKVIAAEMRRAAQNDVDCEAGEDL